MENEIKVSVLCLAYNHEKYIRKCLDGFIMQKTNFKFEVLINDDASTDNTAQIIREYEEKYPDIIKPIYQTENQHSKGVKIMLGILVPLITGKYVAFCEGDDYWCDENKLQIQYDIMEANNDCKMSIHRVGSCRENGELFNVCKPNFDMDDGKMSSRRYIEIGMNYQLSGLMLETKAYKEYATNPPEFKKVIKSVGDVPLMLYFGQLAPVYYFKKIMSIHRSESIGSWSQKQRQNRDGRVAKFWLEQKKMMEEFNKYTNYIYNDLYEYRINLVTVRYLLEIGDKKEMRKKLYKDTLKKWIKENPNKKEVRAIMLKFRFPSLIKIYYKLKGRKNGKRGV